MRKYKSKKSAKSNNFLVSLIIIVILIVGYFAIRYLLNKSQDVRQFAAETPSINRVYFANKNWYVNGANMPWYNWACDFGCNSTIGKSGGVSTNQNTISTALSQAHTNGLNVIRWWVFPGDAWQITRDSQGIPSDINPAVYADFDAALQLANQYDLYFDFVLFSSPTAIPTSWQTDSTQRAKLTQVLGTLFAHYNGNPHILSWEIYNEPEFDVWNGKITENAVVSTATSLATSVHTNSPGTLVTVGNAFADGIPMWLNAGLDFYSPHWYDYMNSGNYCIICHDYNYYVTTLGANKPIVIGEYYTGDSTTNPTSSYRFDYWYKNGYAGAWGWSLFPNQTSDKLAVDMTAAKNFASTHFDLGPSTAINISPTIQPTATSVPNNTPTAIPTSTPKPTPTIPPNDSVLPTISISSPLAGSTVAARNTVNIVASATDNVGVTRVEFRINNTLTCTDTSSTYTCNWKVPGSKNKKYTISAKAFDAAGNSSTATVSVTAR